MDSLGDARRCGAAGSGAVMWQFIAKKAMATKTNMAKII